MAEANSEASKICVQCGTAFEPIKPKRGATSRRCTKCYPPAERQRNLREVRRSVMRRKGNRVPEDERKCPDCGSTFKRHKAKWPFCDDCGARRTQELARQRGNEKWSAWRSVNPKPPCRECGAEIAEGNGRLSYCSKACEQKRNRRVNSATRRTRIMRQQPELFDPIEILERDGWRCYLCGVDTPKALRGTQLQNAPELDHVKPLAKGGSHTRGNVACACHACNAAKSDTFLD